MEQKNTKYLLALALLSIWGLLGFRIYNKMKPEQLHFTNEVDVLAEKPVVKKDTFQLLVNYKDPFLSEKLEAKIAQPIRKAAPKRIAKTIASKKKVAQKFPKIIYKGNLKLKSGRKAVLVNIDGKTQNWGWGETISKMTLNQIYEDSIRISFNGTQQTFLKATN